MSVYTGRGDDGQTDLRTMDRVSKASHRIEAYGTVDELNALIGSIRPVDDDIDRKLRTVQNHLHVVQADFANPGDGDGPTGDGGESNGGSEPDEGSDPRITADHVDRLEEWIDDYDEELEPLTSFILPGGGDLGGRLHHARTVCRRAERRAVALAQEESAVNPVAVTYLNRLSDALFVLGRVANAREGVSEESPTY